MNKNIKRFLLCAGVLALTLGGCGSKDEPKEEVKKEESGVGEKRSLCRTFESNRVTDSGI